MTSFRTQPSLNSRLGLTLIEIMIALTMTLIVLGAMMTAFQFASEQMQMGRGVMEMANRLRAAEELLRSDLSNLTVDPRPYTESTNPNGYFEIVEGPRTDSTSGSSPGSSNYLGDLDDVWMGTVRSESQPFRGRYISTTASGTTVGPSNNPTIQINYAANIVDAADIIESPLAEIVWWTDFVDKDGNSAVSFDESVIVFRRVLLIRPGLDLPYFTTFGAAVSYLATNDISARIEEVDDSGDTLYRVVANSLDDLASRQVRFCHNPVLGASAGAVPTPAIFPYVLHRNSLWLTRSADYSPTGSYDLDGSGTFNIEPNGNDIILTDVAAFDLKVYSPMANVVDMNLHPTNAADIILAPDDVAYVDAQVGLTPAQLADVLKPMGAYVNLGHSGGGWFSDIPTTKSQLRYPFFFDYRFPTRDGFGSIGGWPEFDVVYDTWTPLYESDGLDQDGDLLIDQGTNGIDNGGTAAPDDDAERETRPPYPYPVRGVKATIRLVEKTTKQIHQSSVIHSYVPE